MPRYLDLEPITTVDGIPTIVIGLKNTAADGDEVARRFQIRDQDNSVLINIDALLGESAINTGTRVNSITETVGFGDFTDGGGANGTYTMTESIPAGATILNTKVLVPEGFASGGAAGLTIGDGTDADRYNTLADILSDAATGVQSGAPSGSTFQVAAVAPVLTVAADSDFGLIDAGSVTVTIYYIVEQ